MRADGYPQGYVVLKGRLQRGERKVKSADLTAQLIWVSGFR
jgi:hypothetical protein